MNTKYKDIRDYKKEYCPVCRKLWEVRELRTLRCPMCGGRTMTEEERKKTKISYIRTD